jgi:hypothetical protein
MHPFRLEPSENLLKRHDALTLVPMNAGQGDERLPPMDAVDKEHRETHPPCSRQEEVKAILTRP